MGEAGWTHVERRTQTQTENELATQSSMTDGICGGGVPPAQTSLCSLALTLLAILKEECLLLTLASVRLHRSWLRGIVFCSCLKEDCLLDNSVAMLARIAKVTTLAVVALAASHTLRPWRPSQDKMLGPPVEAPLRGLQAATL